MTNPDESDQVVQRRANLEDLRRLGVDPYPRRFDVQDSIDTLVQAHGAKNAEALDAEPITTRTAGRILTVRTFGKANFLVLSDGRTRVQVYVRQDALSERDFKLFKLLDFGDWVGVEPRPTSSRSGRPNWSFSRSVSCRYLRSGTA
jgi:lysyl-tRNA synthetase class 2